jgi:DNA recombination-dependent growth factor C
VRRYRIEGKVPSPRSDEFSRRLTDKRFLPLAAREERTYGWVTADNLLLTQFDAETVMRGARAAFSLRVDRRRVDAKLLRAQLDLEVRGRRRASREAGETGRLSRDERQRLRRDLHDELLRQTNPSVSAHVVLLDPERRTLAFLSLSRSANETLRAHFRDTFDADLAPLTPWRRGAELLAERGGARALDPILRTEFRASATRATEAAR